MATAIGPLNVRRSGWLAAPPERVWQEFESFDRMRAWYGTGHELKVYEPRAGGMVVTDAGGDDLVFSGRVLVFDPPGELTFEQDWAGHGWQAPALITFRLTPVAGGTMVELFQHGFEAASEAPGDDLNGFESGWDNHHLLRLREIVEGADGGADPYEALAHPVRRQILELLREEPDLGAGEIAARFPDISRPAVSRHLAVLRRSRLVHSRAHGREQRYAIDAAPVTEIYRTFLQAFVPIAERSLPNLKRVVEEGPG